MNAPHDPILDRWDDVDRHLARLLELDPAARPAELSRIGHDDAGLERTLKELLDASSAGARFDSGPNVELVTAALEALAPEEPLPARVGAYRIVACLGRGGMGTVFLAQRDDPAFPNRVALKLLRRGVDTDDVLARFHAERQILASLHHPGIATVFDAGTSDDGRPFLVMEYVEGGTLTAHCKAHRLDATARLHLFMAVLRAVAHAHERGVVHRDLKPSNILVTDPEAHVKLLDFGIAKLVDAERVIGESPVTHPGTRVMTPGFASPEQVMGLPTGEASDIYQLGLLLYELLTGRRPFEDLPAHEYERAVTTTEPDPPSRALRQSSSAAGTATESRALARLLSGDLDAIVLRCLRREPRDRYESVQALHDDVARHLANRPVVARRGNAVYRLQKLARRRGRLLVGPAIVVLVIAAAALVVRDIGRNDASGIRLATGQPEARLLYNEGLRAYRRGDNRVADQFFHAALEEDSSFALAAFHAAETTDDYDRHAAFQLRNLAWRLAGDATDQERLVIRARWAAVMEDPSLAAYADSLTARFPAEPEGYYLLGSSTYRAGQFLEAVEQYEHAVSLDSLSLHSTRAQCVACDALGSIIVAYRLADAWQQAVVSSERWTQLQPHSASTWHALASTLLYIGRFDESLEARGRAAALRVGHVGDLLFHGVLAIHRGDFDEADRLFRLHLRTGTAGMRSAAAHWLAISLRNQGRYAEALETADVMLEASRPATPNGWWDIPASMVRAQALFEMGRFRDAAEQFESNVRDYEEYSVSRQARGHAWQLTHAGTARAAAGDTAALAVLADRVQHVGAQSSYGRDTRLHHYLRALLAKARGAPEREVEERLRAALYSLPHGYSRINLELGENLLRQKRFEEAAAVAGAALRNSSESNGLYATRTEFHDLLGRVWQAAGRRDSALVHVRAALDAWRNADPILRPRVADLERRLALLDHGS